jgi:SAM-dependent methyltransferase
MDLIRYITKTTAFKFRGIDFSFDLSQELFSSAGIDTGTKLLLKVFSKVLDGGKIPLHTKNLPALSLLDAGCGTGVIGICAAKAIIELGGYVSVRSQDRDELARLFTEHNAQKNGISPDILKVFTEPMLTGFENNFDLILSNIPAKAGAPVLDDFISRSINLLNPGGKAFIVAVHTLAEFFREKIQAFGAEIELEEKSSGHSVFIYSSKPSAVSQGSKPEDGFLDDTFLDRYPFYERNFIKCSIEDIPLAVKTVYGAGGFDKPGIAVTTAARLLRRINPEKFNLAHNRKSVLVHEPGQGFFPCWLVNFFQRKCPLVLSGRNILSLEASIYNIHKQCLLSVITTQLPVPAADLKLGLENLLNAAGRLGGKRFGFIAVFSAEHNNFYDLWETLSALLDAGGVFIISLSSVYAERFDRIKPAGYKRLGDLKRKGFRVLVYSQAGLIPCTSG